MKTGLRTSWGWTLVELLTVIAILVLLVAISVPMIGSVLESSRKAHCVSNLRTFTSAALLYSADKDGELLPVLVNHRAAGETRQGSPWVNLLWSGGYLTPSLAGRQHGRGSVFECRSRRGEQSDVIPAHHRYHYGYNGTPGFPSVRHTHETYPSPNVRYLNEILYPEQTMAFAEVNQNYAIYPHLNHFRIYPHNGGMLASYFDGHVEWLQGPLPIIPSSRRPGEGAPFY